MNVLVKQDNTGGRVVTVTSGDTFNPHHAANVTTKLQFAYDGAARRLFNVISDAGYPECKEAPAAGLGASKS